MEKKKIAWLLCFILSLFLFVACNEDICQHRDADDDALCDKCGDEYMDGKDEEEETHEHDWSVWNTTTPATCATDGEEYRSCICGEIEKRAIAADDGLHTFTGKNVDSKYLAFPASCETPATYYYSCVCGAKGTETFEVGAFSGHDFTVMNIAPSYEASPATCTASAMYYYSCKCGAKGTQIFTSGNFSPHVYTEKNTTEQYFAGAATCTSAATYYYSCSCGAKGMSTFTDGQPLLHAYTVRNTTVDYLATDASCTAAAAYYYSCICGAKGAETYSDGAVGEHSYITKIISEGYLAQNASCTAFARYYYSCSCGKRGAEVFEYGEMLPHTYTEKIAELAYLAFAATCGTPATYFYSCSCGAKGSETFTSGSANGHNYTVKDTAQQYFISAATCTTPAKYYYSCSCGERGGAAFEYGTTIPHTYNRQRTSQEYVASAATCTMSAKYYYSCSCGAIGENVFTHGETLPHVYNKQNTDKQYSASSATCTVQASYYYSCYCGAKGETTFKSGALVPHQYNVQNTNSKYCASEATCTSLATFYYSCYCGATGTDTFEYGAVIPHVYNRQKAEWQYLASKATCTTIATYYYSCHCGTKGSKTFIYGTTLPHVYDEAVVNETYLANEASCVAPASYFYSCSCGDKGDTTFEYGLTAPHKYTATSGATNIVYTFVKDGKNFIKDGVELLWNHEGDTTTINLNYIPYMTDDLTDAKAVELLAAGYVASSWIAMTEASCGVKGYYAHQCSICSAGEFLVISVDHEWDGDTTDLNEIKQPTCAENGGYEGTCLNCGNEFILTAAMANVVGYDPANYLATSQHEVDNSFAPIKTAPTCNAQGYTTYLCSICATEYRTDFVPAAHKYSAGIGATHVVYTFVKNGATYIRDQLDDIKWEHEEGTATFKLDYIPYMTADLADAKAVELLNAGYVARSWVAMTEASCGVKGYYAHYCTVCHAGEFLTIDVRHTWDGNPDAVKPENYVNASCTTIGGYMGQCSTCPATYFLSAAEAKVEGYTGPVAATQHTKHDGTLAGMTGNNFNVPHEDGQASSCTQQGYAGFDYCDNANCSAHLPSYEDALAAAMANALPLADHTYYAANGSILDPVEIEANCMYPAFSIPSCAVCGLRIDKDADYNDGSKVAYDFKIDGSVTGSFIAGAHVYPEFPNGKRPVALEPTCNAQGRWADVQCTVCSYTDIGKNIDPINPGPVPTYDASMKDGDMVGDYWRIDIVEPSCMFSGKAIAVCIACEVNGTTIHPSTVIGIIEPTPDHRPESGLVVAQEPTCAAPGRWADVWCEICARMNVGTSIAPIDPGPHPTYDASMKDGDMVGDYWRIDIVEPSCTVAGSVTAVCVECEKNGTYIHYIVIKTLEPNEDHIIKGATYVKNEDGTLKVQNGAHVVTALPTPATPLTPTPGFTPNAGSCRTDINDLHADYYECETCNQILDISVALAHKPVGATCTAAGHCSECNEEVTEALGHNMEKTDSMQVDETGATYFSIGCTRCDFSSESQDFVWTDSYKELAEYVPAT